MTNAMIYRAIDCWEKENKQKFDIWKSLGNFPDVIRELQDSIAEWPSSVTGLIGIDNWNTSSLIDKNGNMRKPKAYIQIKHTHHNNIILEWYPCERSNDDNLRETDFRYWSNDWYGAQSPYNRIVMIRSVNIGQMLDFMNMGKGESHSHEYLLQAIHHHIHYIVNILKKLIDIELLSDMYFEYEALPITRRKTRTEVKSQRLVSCEILSIEEIRKRKSI